MKKAPISKKEIFKMFKIYEDSKYKILSLNHLSRIHKISKDRLFRLAEEYISGKKLKLTPSSRSGWNIEKVGYYEKRK